MEKCLSRMKEEQEMKSESSEGIEKGELRNVEGI